MRAIPSFLSRSRYYSAVVLIVASLLLPLVLAVGRAEALPPTNIDEKVTQWLYYRGIWSCIGNFGEESNDDYTLSESDVKAGKWFHDDKKGFGYLGPSLDDADITKGDDNDGTVSCKDGSPIDRATENYFGFTDEVEFLCAIDDAMDDLGQKDAIQPAIGDADCETSGSWDIKSSKDGGDGNWRSALTTVLTESLADKGGRPKYHLGDNADSGAWYYWIGRRGLEIFCGNGKSIAEGVETPAGDSKDIVDVTYVDPATGDATSGINYFLANTSRDQESTVHDAYYGKGTGENASDRKCKELAALTNDFADDFKEYIGKHPNEEPPSDDTLPGGSIGDSSNSPLDVGCGGGPGDVIDAVLFVDNVINWITCPIIIGFVSFVHTLENQIVAMLCVNESEIFGSATTSCSDTASNADETSAGYKAAWNVFRIIALALLAITGLVMVLAQSAGLEIFDAYTIRKTLPRLLIAAIGISLSWPLLQFLVGFTNDLGIGVRALIYAPFNSRGIADDLVLSGGGGAIAKLFAAGYLVSLGIFGSLLLAATAALAVLIAFGVLIIRNILVIALIIFAPVAIVMYILPNTQNVWKIWWSFLSKALLMFPIITAFIALGHVFSAIALSDADPSFLQKLIGFGAYFAPYFLIPATFRFAGGAIATIGGFANDRSRGAFDSLRKRRQAVQAGRYQRAVNGKLWDPDSLANKKMAQWAAKNKNAGGIRGKTLGNLDKFTPNELAGWAAAPHKAAAWAAREGNVPMLSRYGRRLQTSTHGAILEESQKWMEHVNKHGANDKFYSAVGGMYDGLTGKDASGISTQDKLVEAGFAKWADDGKGGRRIVANRSLKTESDFHKMAEILEHSTSDSEQKAAFALKANASYTGEMFRDPEMNYASTAVGAALGRAAHGFLTSTDSADNENLIAEEAGGDIDFAHAAAVQAQAIGGRSNPDNKAGYGTHYDAEAINPRTGKKGAYVTAYESDRAWAVVDTVKPGDYAQAKGNIFKKDRMGGIFKDALDLTSGDQAKRQTVIDRWASEGVDAHEINSRINRATNAKAAIEDTLLSVAGPYSQSDPTAKKMAIDIIDSDPQLKAKFAAYRRYDADPDTRRGGRPPEEDGPPPGMPTPGGG